LSQAEKVFSLLESCHDSLAETKGGALSFLRSAMHHAVALVQIDSSLETQHTRIENAFYELEDVDQTFRDYLSGIDFSPGRLDQCEERLQAIRRLEKKYGEGIEEIISYRNEAVRKIEAFAGRDEEVSRLELMLKEKEKELIEKARELSRRRKEAAQRLESSIQVALRHLGMPKALFSVTTGYREGKSGKLSCGPFGYDRIEFLISPNEGEPERPLREIASGGELSRVMLAIKSVLSETDHVDTLIFDEIDTGISGKTAHLVGEKIKLLSSHHQIICVTHSPQIASAADTHFKIEKVSDHTSTHSLITRLAMEERVVEVARLLSGRDITENSLRNAEEMIHLKRN